MKNVFIRGEARTIKSSLSLNLEEKKNAYLMKQQRDNARNSVNVELRPDTDKLGTTL
ncbi:hypothetical protein J6590_084089 [Homalodisca vitripennis]|nr:hypothetical protein J6590_084089 [Homalodisca vitripennis]